MPPTEKCQHCGGQVLSNYGEKQCLQCGWEPKGIECQAGYQHLVNSQDAQTLQRSAADVGCIAERRCSNTMRDGERRRSGDTVLGIDYDEQGS